MVKRRIERTALALGDDAQDAATLGAFERPHLVAVGNRRDLYERPSDIAHAAFRFGIHCAAPSAIGSSAHT
jgi:hypothetical protein